jgi:hypothetical protein
MRIERIRAERVGSARRIVADVVWEDREAPTQALVMRASGAFADDLEPSPNGILVAVMPLAMWMGERRVRIEGTVCCRLRDGLRAAMQLFSLWYERCRPLEIEPTRGFAPTRSRREPRAASFFSGGVDALALLRSNRLDYPADHPASIRECILLFGLNSYDADADGPRPERLALFEAQRERMSSFADRVGVTLVPIQTNIRALYPDFRSWTDVGFGAGTLSTALCLSRRIDRVELASGGIGMRHPPKGSHAWLDHQYSTEAVGIRHAQIALTRLEKTRLVAEWDEGLAVLRSCFYQQIPRDGQVNCGECEKCVRTMLALVALGKLHQAPTFPLNDLTPSMLEPVWIEDPVAFHYYTQCVDALVVRGRHDLVAPLRRKLTSYHRRERRHRIVAALRRATGA